MAGQFSANPYQKAWRRRSRGAGVMLHYESKGADERQMKLNFCAESYRPMVMVAAALAVIGRPMTEDELAAYFEELFP